MYVSVQTTFHGNLGVTQEAGAPTRPFLKACSHPYPAPLLVCLDNSLRSGMETLLKRSDSVRTTLPGRQCAVRHLYWATWGLGGRYFRPKDGDWAGLPALASGDIL